MPDLDCCALNCMLRHNLGRKYFFTSINIKAATATDEARCVM